MLSAEKIKKLIHTELNVLFFDTINSTNTYAKTIASMGCKNTLIVAAQQTQGRGRSGKSFESPQNGIYFSLLFDIQSLPSLDCLTIAAAVAVCKAIEELTPEKPMIKWVNDVFLHGKKLAGILCENVACSGKVVVGIGINTAQSELSRETSEIAARLSLSEQGKAQLIAKTADILCSELAHTAAKEQLEYYKKRSLVLGKQIEYVKNNKRCAALALDIDALGGLVVQNEKGEKLTLNSGEVSLIKNTYSYT